MTVLLLSPAEALGHVPTELRAADAGVSPVDRLISRPCCCGGIVWADPADPRDALRAHYRASDPDGVIHDEALERAVEAAEGGG